MACYKLTVEAPEPSVFVVEAESSWEAVALVRAARPGFIKDAPLHIVFITSEPVILKELGRD